MGRSSPRPRVLYVPMACLLIPMLAQSREEMSTRRVDIGDMTLDNITSSGQVPSIACPKKVWTTELVRAELLAAVEKIRTAPLQQEPFAHVAVNNLFSDCFYQDLMRELPRKDAYTLRPYPGTNPYREWIDFTEEAATWPGKFVVPQMCDMQDLRQRPCYRRFTKAHDEHFTMGRAITVSQARKTSPLWTQVFRLTYSMDFMGLLVRRFTGLAGDGIPEWKQRIVGTDPRNFRNSAALRIEPPEYHLAPHADISVKIVSWQFFHPPDNRLRDRRVGTIFYAPKPSLADKWKHDDSMDAKSFVPDLFDEVFEHPVVPNAFVAWAPNNHSWHGASVDRTKLGGDADSRRTFLGFIVTKDAGLHHFGKGDGLGLQSFQL